MILMQNSPPLYDQLPMIETVGPTLGNGREPILYCLDSDESSTLEPESSLSPHAKSADEDYIKSNVAFTLSVLPTTQPHDLLILDHTFTTMIPFLQWHQKIYRQLGLNPTHQLHFAPSKKFAPLAQKLATQAHLSTLSTIGFSYLQEQTFPNPEMLEISKKMNAKTSLPELAKMYGFPIPPAKILPWHELSLPSLHSLGFPRQPVYLKIDGLGGGYNVKKICTEQDLTAFMTTHQKKSPLIAAQQELPRDDIEREHIFTLYPDTVEYLYSSIQLTTASSWYGNLFEPNFSLHPSQRDSLEKAAHALRKEGYSHPKGFLAGFDSLMNDRELSIIEINARWLGSLPIYRLLKKLQIPSNRHIFFSYDDLFEEEISLYQAFAEKHLLTPHNIEPFSWIPVSFSPYLTEHKHIICFIVIGKLEAFQQEVRSIFSPHSFQRLDLSMEQIDSLGSQKSRGSIL